MAASQGRYKMGCFRGTRSTNCGPSKTGDIISIALFSAQGRFQIDQEGDQHGLDSPSF